MYTVRKIRLIRWSAIAMALTIAILLTACGGGNSVSQNPMPPSPAGSPSSTAVNVNIGDAPSDRVIAFELTINSIVLTRSDNSTVSLLSAPRRIEVTHLAGTSEPLVLSSVPQGSYTSATISVSAPEVVFIDNTGRPVEREFPTFSKTITVNFNPALSVGTTPLVLTLDANVGASVSIDPVSGNVTLNPTFNITNLPLPAAGHDDDQRPENGELEHIVGQLTNVGASSFTIKLQSGMTLTFNINSQTRFEDAGGLSTLPANALLRVEGVTQQDGTLLAKEVELLAGEEMENEGIVTSVTGNPATSFTFVVHDGSGSMMNSAMLGTTVTVTVDSRTEFTVDPDNIDLSALSLPAFSASTISKGQRVEAESETENEHGMTGMSVRRVKLEQQALTGTVSALSGGQFTLTVADDSAFKLLTGKSSITVLTQRNTEVKNLTVSNGLSVRVRGLLFFDPSRATYTLVAGRITNP